MKTCRIITVILAQFVLSWSVFSQLMPPDDNYENDHWNFNTTTWLSDSNCAPVSFTNLADVPDWDGNALQVDSTNVVFLEYPIVSGTLTNITFYNGTICAWVKPDWNSGVGPGEAGRLIDVGIYSTNSPSSWWSLYFSPDGSTLNFSSETNGVFTNYLTCPISWNTNTWHFVSLTYNLFESDLYIDGQFVTNGPAPDYIPDAATTNLNIGSDITGVQQIRAQLDDLATFDYALSDSGVSNQYLMGWDTMNGITNSGGGGDDGGGFGPGSGVIVPDYGTNLYLEITNVLNNRASGWIHNSSIYVPYTIFSRQSLLWPIWTPEATLYGSWSTNLTPFSVPMLARGNLFLEAESEIAPRIVGGGNSSFSALRRDGTVWTWGNGNYGQLGNGDWTNTSTPVQVVGLSNIVAIAQPSDGDFTLALDANGNVWSWGTNYSGQLGRDDGLYEAEDTPGMVPGLSNVVAIAGGSAHSMALKSDGTVWTWGDNAYGDLGDGSGTQRDYAAPVPGITNAISIASGDSHCFALCADGRVWGWGLNELDELGIGNEDDQPVPVMISGLTNTVALSGGLFHSIALLSDGTVEAWGDGFAGEIGDINSSTPVPVPGLSNIVTIASGKLHNLFIDTTGNVYAWGNDDDSQFGDNGTNWESTTPYLVSTISNVTAIAAGEESSIVSLGNGNIYTFGQSYEYEPTPTLTDLYTNYSSDGSGLPDWWERQYFGRLGLDPNSDPVGDGWSLIQDYEQNLDPTNFVEPPAITGLTVTQTNGQSEITLTWDAETPTPLDYAIYRIDYNYNDWQYGSPQQIGEVAGNQTTFTDNGSVPGGDKNSIYEAEGIYGGGTSPFSDEAYVNSQPPSTFTDNLPFVAQLVRNGTGRWQIMFSGLPTGLQTIQLSWQSGSGSTTQDISVSNLVNGVYSIPDSDVLNDLGTSLYVQGVGPGGLPGQEFYVGTLPVDAPYFVDGRQHMEQNLKFLIRGAMLNEPFAYFGTDLAQFNEYNTNIEEFSFLRHDWDTAYPEDYNERFVLDDLWPFEANYNLWNCLADTSRNVGDSPFGNTNFVFQPNFSNDEPAPAILGQGDPYLILAEAFTPADNGPSYNSADWGVTLNSSNTTASLQANIANLYGLPYETGLMVSLQGINVNYQEINPGDYITTENGGAFMGYASWCPTPTLQFTNYYLAPLINPSANTFNLPPNDAYSSGWNQLQPYPLPIDEDWDESDSTIGPGFSVTNQTPAVMLGSVGQPMILGAWAKYSIDGSSPAKYAYLGQYFTTNAWEVDDSGNITTTNAGVISPYGEFFPTQPGPVALITMTNLDTGTQATGIVNVISLALDANHDGTIDPTWNGPDMTSPSRPYIFWCNNNFDRWDYDNADATNYMDDVQAGDNSDPAQNLDPDDPDCNYVVNGNRVIPDTRDLEDFARLWICGMQSNLLAALPSGSTITLNWGDVGNPNPNNPTIDLFAAADPNGGIGYLTNETVAAAQTDTAQCPYIGRVGPGSNLVLNASTFANDWAGNYFIWCGVSNGSGGLNLTITGPNSNVLAQTTAYIQIVDIKQMYERWTVGDDPNTPPVSDPQLATNDLPPGVSEPFRYVNPPTPNTPYILYVHGWNMEMWVKDRFAETAFKRLYWQGYQGRFGEFRWPTGYGFNGWESVITDPDNFDNSESNAWSSGFGLLSLLNNLNAQYPGNVYMMAHSMGNVVAGEALRQAGTNEVANTYVAMQSAISAHCYDATTPNRWTNSIPDRYAQYWTNGAPCYFNGIVGAGTFVNFFNVNDYALNAWTLDQDLKPDFGYQYSSMLDQFLRNVGLSSVSLYFPTNTYEIYAYAAPAQSYALGAQENVMGFGQGNLENIWPPDPYGQHNYTSHFWHSAEFRGDLPLQVNFWKTLLGQTGFEIR